jgi:hypothetical protein
MPTPVSVKYRLDPLKIRTFNHISTAVLMIAQYLNFVVIYSPEC